MRRRAAPTAVVLVTALAAVPAIAQPTPPTPTLRLEPAATGLNQPLFATAPRGDDRLFIVEKTGAVRVRQANGTLNATPFLSLGVATASEQGLLGMAFDPDFAANRYVYVNFNPNTTPPSGFAGTSIVRRYTVSATNPNVVDPASAKDIITYAQPFTNHKGGWLDFSPRDGHLYIATGDGGSSNDPGNRAQTFTSDLGKLLRVDPDGDDFPTDATRNYAVPADNPWAGEAGANATRRSSFAYGLRNPFRNAFDAANGDLYLADVGQNTREEVDYQPGTSPGGENYGWRLREGKIQNPAGVGGARPADNVDPVLDYPRSGTTPTGSGGSISGGVVYRGEFLEPLIGGQYFYADYLSNMVRSFDTAQTRALPRLANGRLDAAALLAAGFTPTTRDWTSRLGGGAGINSIVSFGVDGRGEMYVVSIGGTVYRVTADRLATDANFDNIVDLADFFLLRQNFGLAGSINDGDFSGDGSVGVADLDLLVRDFGMVQGSGRAAVEGLDVIRAFAATVPEPATLGIAAVGVGALTRRRRA